MAKRPRVSLASIVAETAGQKAQPGADVIQFSPEVIPAVTEAAPAPVLAVVPKTTQAPPAAPESAPPVPDMPPVMAEVAPPLAEIAIPAGDLGPSDAAVVHLTEILDLKAADALRDDLVAARGGPVQIDASRVQRLGGLCLQVLLSAQRTWAVEGAAFRVVDPSHEFRDTLAAFGATALVQDA